MHLNHPTVILLTQTFGTPTVKAVIDHKWDLYGWRKVIVRTMVYGFYCMTMTVFGILYSKVLVVVSLQLEYVYNAGLPLLYFHALRTHLCHYSAQSWYIDDSMNDDTPHNSQEDHTLTLPQYWESGAQGRFHIISNGYLICQVCVCVCVLVHNLYR